MSAATFTATVALVLGLAARFLVLASDPAYDLWAGYVTDEGRWTEQARSLVLFGQTDLTSVLSRMHLLLALLFQAAEAVSFQLFGVSFTSARLVTAISGAVLLLATFLILRRRVTGVALAVATCILALQVDLVTLSRIAIPEVPALLFESRP